MNPRKILSAKHVAEAIDQIGLAQHIILELDPRIALKLRKAKSELEKVRDELLEELSKEASA